ncbi:MAG: hypothetical protein AAFQ89_17360 [Cyanobacteria bacterium J06626_18]
MGLRSHHPDYSASRKGGYQPSDASLVFPGLPIRDRIPQLIDPAFQTGMSGMLRELRKRLHTGESL